MRFSRSGFDPFTHLPRWRRLVSAMFGRLVAGLIVVGLAIGVWALWPAGDSGTTTTTAADAAPTTTLSETTSTTGPAESTTTNDPTGADVITTVAQAEIVLRTLWLGWFDGIYNQDEAQIREVVGSQNQLDAAIAAFGVMDFDAQPTLDGIHLSEIEILRADKDCTAIWARLSTDFRPGETSGVEVLRVTDTGWKSVSSWIYKTDLWGQDCDAQLEPLS